MTPADLDDAVADVERHIGDACGRTCVPCGEICSPVDAAGRRRERLDARAGRSTTRNAIIGRVMPMAIPPSLRGALDTYAERLRARFGGRLREVRLFGSYARGTATEQSDVDVLVVVDDLTEAERLTIVDEATAVMLETDLPIAPLPLSHDKLEEIRRRERALARTLDREGIVLD
jgi:uncharacterized protein